MTEDANREPPAGIEFVIEDDGSITAHDHETGLYRGGETREEALQQLTEVLILNAGGGEPIEDEDAFLREIGIDPEEVHAARKRDDELPEFLR